MAAGEGFPGRDLILKWEGQQVAGVREKGVAFNGEPIDVSNDDSAGWRELLSVPGQHQVDISLSGVAKIRTLREVFFSSDKIGAVIIEYPDGSVLSGDFYLATYNETGPYNDAMTFECTLQSTGEVEFTGGTGT